MHRKALDTRLALLGEVHADSAESLNNLANALSALKRHEEALDLYQRSLEVTAAA